MITKLTTIAVVSLLLTAIYWKRKEIWDYIKRPTEIAMWVLVGIGMITTTHNITTDRQQAEATYTPAAQMSYEEWRAERAKWLQKKDSFKEYMKSEAENTVDMKVLSEAQRDADNYLGETEVDNQLQNERN